MLKRILAIALAAAALGAPPALDAGDARGEHAASLSGGAGDARGEHAASLSGREASSQSAWSDVRTADAAEPFARPVVVDVDAPASPGFDWTAAIIGPAAGLALAVLAGVGVTGRRRPVRPSIG